MDGLKSEGGMSFWGGEEKGGGLARGEANHDDCYGEEDPVADKREGQEVVSERSLSWNGRFWGKGDGVGRMGVVTYKRAGSRWIVCTTKLDIVMTWKRSLWRSHSLVCGKS